MKTIYLTDDHQDNRMLVRTALTDTKERSSVILPQHTDTTNLKDHDHRNAG